jgi:hypothetical protein
MPGNYLNLPKNLLEIYLNFPKSILEIYLKFLMSNYYGGYFPPHPPGRYGLANQHRDQTQLPNVTSTIESSTIRTNRLL